MGRLVNFGKNLLLERIPERRRAAIEIAEVEVEAAAEAIVLVVETSVSTPPLAAIVGDGEVAAVVMVVKPAGVVVKAVTCEDVDE